MSAPDGLIEADPKVGRLRGKRCERDRRASCEANRSGAAAMNPISARIAAASNTNLRDDGHPTLTRMGYYVAADLSMATGQPRLPRQRRRQAWPDALMVKATDKRASLFHSADCPLAIGSATADSENRRPTAQLPKLGRRQPAQLSHAGCCEVSSF